MLEALTAVVPRESDDDVAYNSPMVNTPGTSDIPWINDRPSGRSLVSEALSRDRSVPGATLYDREVYAQYRQGSVLLYRHDTWHRGPPLCPGFVRLAHNLTFRKAEAWISTLHPGWAWAVYKPDQRMERPIAQATPSSGSVLGFRLVTSLGFRQDQCVEARYGHWALTLLLIANNPCGRDVTRSRLTQQPKR